MRREGMATAKRLPSVYKIRLQKWTNFTVAAIARNVEDAQDRLGVMSCASYLVLTEVGVTAFEEGNPVLLLLKFQLQPCSARHRCLEVVLLQYNLVNSGFQLHD